MNANGDVLFLSVASIVNVGSVDAPDTYVLPFGDSVASPFSMILAGRAVADRQAGRGAAPSGRAKQEKRPEL